MNEMKLENDINYFINKWGKQAEILKYAEYWQGFSIRDASIVLIKNRELEKEIFLFGFVDIPDDYEIASLLFSKLEERVKSLGGKKLYGPVNFAPWLDSKWQTEGWDLPFIYPQPQNQKYLPVICSKLGYSESYSYVSHIVDLEDRQFGLYKKQYEKLLKSGYEFKHYIGAEIYSVIGKVINMSSNLFNNEPLYSPILPEFIEYYYSKFDKIEPVFSCCFKDEVLCGYSFHYENTGVEKLWVAMIVAVDRSFASNGIFAGIKYFSNCYPIERGFKEVVHHMIYNENSASLKASKDKKSVKKYSVFGKNI